MAKTKTATKSASKTASKKPAPKTASAKKAAPKRKTASGATSVKATSVKATSVKATSSKAASSKGASRNASASKAGEKVVTVDRRRDGRRAKEETAESVATAPKLERREKVNRRRQIDPTTCERDYSDAEVQFMNALDDYKRKNGRMFPTCSEVLEVIRGLGYVQLSPAELAARSAVTGPSDTDLESQAEAEALGAMADSASLSTDNG